MDRIKHSLAKSASIIFADILEAKSSFLNNLRTRSEITLTISQGKTLRPRWLDLGDAKVISSQALNTFLPKDAKITKVIFRRCKSYFFTRTKSRQIKIILFLMVPALLFLGCKTVRDPIPKGIVVNQDSMKFNPVPQTAASLKYESIKLNSYYNDIARFIAGLSIDTASIFYNLSQNREVEKYFALVNNNYDKFADAKLKLIKRWSAAELISVNQTTKTVFYPFSGPDFVYLYSFLPSASAYYLFGLEPVGKIPDIALLKEDSFKSFFTGMDAAISDNLNLSFFITKKMKQGLSNSEIKGVIPVLMFFMARMNLHIQNICPVTFDNEGIPLVMTEEEAGNRDKKFEDGVEISFLRQGDKKISRLYYFSKNIANNGFRDSPEFRKFFKYLPKDITTFVKSCSYLLHQDDFSEIREIIIRHSAFVIQDDSGIPFHFFDDTLWSYSLYGEYEHPISLFGKYMQADYHTAFQKYAQKINFRFGYAAKSNILLAQRKKRD